jgi:hypothetical protein
MGLSLKTRKMLWGRAANRCAFPDCRRELVMDATETDDESIIGEECHIIAREDDGPRGNASFPTVKRDKYDNLILLCNIHHKLIDDQPNKYTIERLKEIKKNHIEWIDSSLNIDKEKQYDDEVYSTYIDEWSRMADIDNWKFWSSWVLGAGEPSLHKDQEQQLQQLKLSLLSRIWPKRYPELEAAFANFRIVLNDFLLVFHIHSVEHNNEYSTEKFYKRLDRWDPEAYSRLGEEYDFHVDLVQDLILELTRAGNYVLDNIRKYIVRNYRLQEGALLVEAGPFMDLTYHTYRVEYRSDERTLIPYPGLQEFKKIRRNRDRGFGTGVDVQDSQT